MIEDIKANKLQLSKNHTDTLGMANAIANIWGENGRETFPFNSLTTRRL